AVFKKFDDYPWVRDRPFLQGLVAMLGPLTTGFERQKALGITLQARIWWYQSRLNISIDRAAYEAYLGSAPTAASPDPTLLIKIEDIQRRMGIVSASGALGSGPSPGDLPAWMVDAPQKVDLNKKADDGVAHGAGADAPYPAHFQAIIEAVTTGKPVPGVREIPNTVVRQAGIAPVGKMQAPRKPWERQQQQTPSNEAGVSSSGNLLDQEFPPV
ncbi:hypothetical protein B0H67DRAFT_451235, partial [Lasiosphaeris hirsuta]